MSNGTRIRQVVSGTPKYNLSAVRYCWSEIIVGLQICKRSDENLIPLHSQEIPSFSEAQISSASLEKEPNGTPNNSASTLNRICTKNSAQIHGTQ